MAPIIEHHGGHSRNPCKPEVRPGAREDSASPAWLAASAMNPRDTTKVYIWTLDTGCEPTLYRKCHYHNIPGKRHKNTWVEPLAGNCPTSSTRQREQVWQKCKIQKNWCTVTVAPTIEHHGGHSWTPANQRWDQVPGRRYYKERSQLLTSMAFERVSLEEYANIKSLSITIPQLCPRLKFFTYITQTIHPSFLLAVNSDELSVLSKLDCDVSAASWPCTKWNVAKFFYQATFHL